MMEQKSIEELRLKREVRERHPLTDYEMILMINCSDYGKFWDWIANAIDRSPSTVLAFSKKWKSDHVHGLHHHVDSWMIDE
jgi:hypothetical protein